MAIYRSLSPENTADVLKEKKGKREMRTNIKEKRHGKRFVIWDVKWRYVAKKEGEKQMREWESKEREQ